MNWPLPPETPWPRFLRQLRHPAPPEGWLEAAAELPEMRHRPMLLRWIAQHRKAPAPLRNRLLPALPWRSLAAIAWDASAHPQARARAAERLEARWELLSTGERRSLAPLAPQSVWPRVWKAPDAGILDRFLQHPRLGAEALEALIQPPLTLTQAEALRRSSWLEVHPVAHAVLGALDRSLPRPGSGLVLGLAAAWLLALPPEECRLAASRMTHPPLRRMARGRAEGHD